MAFKSATRPLCLWCHKPIAKSTKRHYVQTPATYGRRYDDPTCPRTVADCQKLTNEKVVSVDYSYEEDVDSSDQWGKRKRTGRRAVHSYSTWDGESYKNQFFCNGQHAESFGYAAAHHGLRFKKKEKVS